MSRVTIGSLYSDFTIPRTNAREYGANYEQYVKLAETEVVPRKMVEMIIAKCLKDVCNEYGSNFSRAEALLIKQYAESLLTQFEED